MLVGGLANASDAIELLCLSILLPAAQCDLEMSSEDKGWLNAMVFFGKCPTISAVISLGSAKKTV